MDARIAEVNKAVELLTGGAYDAFSFVSTADVLRYLKMANGDASHAAEEIVEYAVAVGMITCEEDFAN